MDNTSRTRLMVRVDDAHAPADATGPVLDGPRDEVVWGAYQVTGAGGHSRSEPISEGVTYAQARAALDALPDDGWDSTALGMPDRLTPGTFTEGISYTALGE